MLFALAPLTVPVLAGETPSASCPATYAGRYRNGQYGFSFSVPAGLAGHWQSPCTWSKGEGCICLGDHGLQFSLPGGGTLGVFADYAAELDDPTLGDVLAAALARIRQVGDDRIVHIESIASAQVHGRQAYVIRATDRPTVNGSGEEFHRIEYVLLSKDGRVDIYLHGPSHARSHDEGVLQQLLASWKWGI
jgi:hypothetical protein